MAWGAGARAGVARWRRERGFDAKKTIFGSTTLRVPESSLTSVLTQPAGA